MELRRVDPTTYKRHLENVDQGRDLFCACVYVIRSISASALLAIADFR